MRTNPDPARQPKASRTRVWQAADRILRSGRRPTVAGVRELLSGGSPNSVTSYLDDWYRELGGRLVAAEAPLSGLPPPAVSLLMELWRLAAKSDHPSGDRATAEDASAQLRKAENLSLVAQAKALEALNAELQRHRASAERSLAETRALLARREAALEEERTRLATLELVLAKTRLDLEIALERRRLSVASRQSKTARRRASKPVKPAKRAKAATSRRPARVPSRRSGSPRGLRSRVRR
jgi:hypothetical protein